MWKAKQNEISGGQDLMGLAAGVIYISCIKTCKSISQNETVTLKNRYKELKNPVIDLK